MATRKIVPRADNEGGIGTALKRWASAFINALNADSATIGTLSGIVKAATGVLSATALGSANLKFFMNAAGSAPEWAKGLKVGQFSRDTSTASGSQSITGVGFKPSSIIFLAVIPATAELSIGLDDYFSHFSIVNNHNITANVWTTATASIVLAQTVSIESYASITSFDSDGFTVQWTKTGAKTGTAYINFLAIR